MCDDRPIPFLPSYNLRPGPGPGKRVFTIIRAQWHWIFISWHDTTRRNVTRRRQLRKEETRKRRSFPKDQRGKREKKRTRVNWNDDDDDDDDDWLREHSTKGGGGVAWLDWSGRSGVDERTNGRTVGRSTAKTTRARNKKENGRQRRRRQPKTKTNRIDLNSD